MTARATLPEGIYTALITPFRDGAVDYDAWQTLVTRQVDAGVAGLVPVGCTGEAAALDVDERERLVRACVEIADGRCCVLAGSGTNVTASTIEMTKLVKAWGADAAMLISPYYNKPQQHGLVAHYTAVARAVDIPQVVYNVPGRTAVNILPSTVREIAAEPNVAAVKEASGDLDQIAEMCTTDLQIFSGDDGLNLEILARGAHGAISVLSNLLPAHLVRMWEAWRDGREDEARSIFAATEPVVAACFRETNPVPTKELLSLSGYCTPEPRLPLVTALPENREWLARFHAETLAPLLEAE